MKRVSSLDVACPACGRLPGQRCIRLDGAGGAAPHPQRRRRAADEQLRLNPDHVQGQQALFPVKDARR